MNTNFLKIAVGIVALGAITAGAQTQPAARWQKLLGNMMLSNVDSAKVQNGATGGPAKRKSTQAAWRAWATSLDWRAVAS
jgi:hypothetical protein